MTLFVNNKKSWLGSKLMGTGQNDTQISKGIKMVPRLSK